MRTLEEASSLKGSDVARGFISVYAIPIAVRRSRNEVHFVVLSLR